MPGCSSRSTASPWSGAGAAQPTSSANGQRGVSHGVGAGPRPDPSRVYRRYRSTRRTSTITHTAYGTTIAAAITGATKRRGSGPLPTSSLRAAARCARRPAHRGPGGAGASCRARRALRCRLRWSRVPPGCGGEIAERVGELDAGARESRWRTASRPLAEEIGGDLGRPQPLDADEQRDLAILRREARERALERELHLRVRERPRAGCARRPRPRAPAGRPRGCARSSAARAPSQLTNSRCAIVNRYAPSRVVGWRSRERCCASRRNVSCTRSSAVSLRRVIRSRYA